jgi:asparagine synthase (glutamine-hydrolysing)
MCGIAGFWSSPGNQREMLVLVREMTNALQHRGPDDAGQWADASSGIALGQRRLSILDLSLLGHQPMCSESGRYWTIFNGEVYNYRELRKELPGVAWRGHSDTEVMLAAIERWGLERAVQRFVGMFAFALWDTRERLLHLVRDRIGIKPLYYGFVGDGVLFGSELKALRCHPEFMGEIDRDALALFVRHNYIPQPYSIYRDTHKLTPGTILTLRSPSDRDARPQSYWCMRQVVEAGQADPFTGSPVEAIEQLKSLLSESVRLRMIADVPVGAFLSGGVDSTTVVALMQAQTAQRVKTFSIGFLNQEYDEAPYAAEIARHLGTDHTELYARPEEVLELIPSLSYYYDEPFSDSSQIPTMLVSALARKQVTVSMSGDGGDELFAGYPRYMLGQQVAQLLKIPKYLRMFGARVISGGVGMFPERWLPNTTISNSRPLRDLLSRRRLDKLRLALQCDTVEQLYLPVISHAAAPTELVLASSEPLTTMTDRSRWSRLNSSVHQMMYLDLLTYLPDDILTKVDRASMSVALEARVPLLDHRVIEFSWRLPLSLKLRQGVAKWILKQIAYSFVPQKLLQQPKRGFAVPLGAWLRGPLRAWAEDLIDETAVRNQGFLDTHVVRSLWKDHLHGNADNHAALWDVISFQAWLKSQRSAPAKLGLAASAK